MKTMVNMLTNVISSQFLLVGILIILMYSPLESFAKRGGFLNFEFLCYLNPGHLDFEGNVCDSVPSKNCDPFFVICISNKPINGESPSTCPVYYLQTKPYYNVESVCNIPYDLRSELKEIPLIELPYPLQEEYYVRIVVKDFNQFTAHRVIAVFSTIFHGIPTSNFNDFVNTYIFMTRDEIKVQNPKASLKISIGLKCDYNLYGKLCVTFCKSIPTDNYICSPKGEMNCKSGWIGSNCLTRDLCKDLVCAKGATCAYLNSKPRCTCNGMIGPQCYPNYNPCYPNPCKNDGNCVLENIRSSAINCYCKYPYHGSRCTLQFDLCQIDPCRNNGKCIVMKNGSRFCKCSPEYTGILCDYLVQTTMNYNLSLITNVSISLSSLKENQVFNSEVMFFILFLLCIIVIIVIGVVSLTMWKRIKKRSRMQENSICMKVLSSNHLPPKVPNEYASVKEDTVYDIIEDRDTYVYQLEDKDGYLVPSRPITPIISPNNISENSDYAPMFNMENAITNNEITDINTKENEYLPPLPTRNIKKTYFKLFRKCNL